jgi:hypothetical protein
MSRLPTIGSIVGPLLVIIGLVSIPADLIQWAKGVSWLRGSVPWWALITIGVVIAWVSGARKIAGRWQLLMADRGASKQLVALQHRLQVADESLASLQSEVTRLHADLAEERAGRANASDRAKRLAQTLSYGEPLSDYLQITDEDRHLVISRLHELSPKLNDMLLAADRVWNPLADGASQMGLSTWCHWLRDSIERNERGVYKRLAEGYANALREGYDPRPYLERLYINYREWRGTVFRLSKVLSKELASIEQFTEWTVAERKFFDDFRGKLALPQLEQVRRRIADYDAANGRLTPGEAGVNASA